MTRGALVWKAIEDRAGRANLDRILNQHLQRGGSWTTEDLRNALEAGTEREWTDWFRQHVYGRTLP
jgi:aminopeptidase N